MKTCSQCGDTKRLDDFQPRKDSKDGRRGACRSCVSERKAKYYKANSEHIKARAAAWERENREYVAQRRSEYYADNREKFRADRRARYEANRDRVAEYREENREHILARKAEYRAANPHKDWACKFRSRASRLGFSDPVVEDFTKEDVLNRYGDLCAYCGGEFQELDHYVPIAKGGPHTLDNVRPSCTSCNRAKANRSADEWKETKS